MTAHWGVPDPAAMEGPQEVVERAFHDVFLTLDRRITLFMSLPLTSLNRLAIQKRIEEIGRE
jgi:arsenate reductase